MSRRVRGNHPQNMADSLGGQTHIIHRIQDNGRSPGSKNGGTVPYFGPYFVGIFPEI